MVVGLSVPGDGFPDLSPFGADKLLHVGGFFTFGVLWLRAGAPLRRLVVLGLVFALASEFYQQFMPVNRSFSLYDALADAVGLALAVGAWTWRHRRPVAVRS